MLKKKESEIFFGGKRLQYQYNLSMIKVKNEILPLIISIEFSRTELALLEGICVFF